MPAADDSRGRRADTAALRAVLHVLFGSWGLGVREAAGALGGVAMRTLFQWREDPDAADVDPVLRQRLSHLLALHKALRAAFPEPTDRRAWLRTPDAEGTTPVERLASGHREAPAAVRARVPDS